MKRRIALLLVICLLTSMVPAATAGGAVDDGILDNEIELVDVGEQDMTGPSESDGIELEADDFLDEPGDILPEDDMPELELGDALDLPEGEALLPESEAQGDASEANDSSDFTIVNGVLTKYNGAGGDVVIPDGVKSIGSDSFSDIKNMTSLTIPGSVTRIERYAFYQCSGGYYNTVVNIQEGLVSIGECAFLRCSFDITIPKSVTTIEEGAFSYCKVSVSPGNTHFKMQDGFLCTADGKTLLFWQWTGKDIAIPEGITRIGKSAFHWQSTLNSVKIPGSVQSIGEYAFLYCSGLKNVVIPDGVKKIEDKAFYGCSNLESVTIPASVGKIGMDVFKDCNLVKIKGYTGSYAETYAKKNKLTFVPLDAPAPEISIPKKLSLGVKETYKLGVKNATFKSSKAAVATVDKKGVITAKKAGTATITVTVKGQKAKKCKVTVLAAPKTIKLSGKSRKMSVGDVIMLMPTLPKKTASKIKWTSSNKSVATVDADGVVRALKKGKAKITAKTFNGKKAVCTVTVGTWPSSVTFDVEAVSIGVKEQLKLKPIVNEGAKTTYTWSVKNNKIAKVSKKGVVTGVKAGTTTVTVKTQNDLTATVKVTVAAAPKKITLNKKKATLPVNQTLQLKATLPKKTASQIKWTTSKKKVATVDETGLVTAVAPGKATITAKTANGKKATCVVTVREAYSADRFESMYDSYESSHDTELDFSPATMSLLSIKGFEDSQDIVGLIEEYNGWAQAVNDNNEAYTNCMDRVLESLGNLFDTAGKTSVVANRGSLKIEIEGVKIESSIDSTQVAGNGGMSREERYLANIRVNYQSNKKDIQSLYKEAKEVRAWCDRISNVGNAAKVLIQEADFYAEAQHKAGEMAEKAAKKAYDLAREKGLSTEQITPLLKNMKKAAENKKLWKGVCDTVKWLSEKVGSLIFAANEAGAAVGTDMAKLLQIDLIADHEHPIGREKYDKVRNKYVLQMNESMKSAKDAIMVDIGVNVGLVAIELTFAKAKTAIAGGLSKFSLGRKLLEKIEKLTEFIGEKWLKRSWLGTNIGATMKTGENVDKYIDDIEHCDDILHGAVKGKVSGVIVDGDTKAPIQGVCVEADGIKVYSKASGSFSIELKYGMYDEGYALKFTKEGYVDATATAEIDEGSDDLNIPMEMFMAGIPIDWEHFPDGIFRKVVTTFDLDNNGYLSDEENSKIKSLNIQNKGISSLEGIGFLNALEELSCANNKLTNLNLSEMSSLKSVNCAWNQLDSLNISLCTGLEKLDCQNNKLVNLNVSWCKSLKELVCAFNKLSTLNVSGCISLESLICDDNSLINLDLSGCTKLKELNCNALQTKAGKLVNLILKECYSLETLDCRWNKLQSLDVTQCKALQKLNCSNNQLNSLKLENSINLKELNCSGNYLTSLDVKGCAALEVLNCSLNKLKALDISACPRLQELYCTSNQIEVLVVLEYLDIRRLKVAQYDDGTRVAVLFGHYDQDNNPSNGKEPIEWLVLEDKGDTLTLISRYALDLNLYHTARVDITWANCTLRSWLNGTFLNAAFTSAEQGKIQTVRVTAEDNPKHGTEAGSDTYDKVWLLSIREAENLFSSNAARICYPTETVKAKLNWMTTNGACLWWLRSPGYDSYRAARVESDGNVDNDFGVGGNRGSVRPVVCLRLS